MFFHIPVEFKFKFCLKFKMLRHENKNVHHVQNNPQLILVVNQLFAKRFEWPKLLQTVA